MSTAITYDRFGGPEVLTLTDVEPALPEAGQVQIAVRAAGINLVDVKLRRGDLAHVFTPKFPVVPGIEVAGVISAVGPGVSAVQVGDAVFGVADAGGYSELALASHVERKPDAADWELAASFSIVGEAAFRTLKHLGVKAGERLLIHGAAGSVGTIATQLAIAQGVEVIGTAGAADLDVVRRRGVTAVAYGPAWKEHVRDVAPDGVDAVLDTAGAGVLPGSIELAGGAERVITIADEAAIELGVRFTGPDPQDRDRAALAKLADLVSGGELELPLGRSYPLAEAYKAHEDLEARRNRGKLVLLP
jgi:NADPH:quinone reductase-like Zn-dependent oxidoreductase